MDKKLKVHKLIQSKDIRKILTGEYCPKCKSKLYPIDEDYIIKYNKCSYCVTWEKKDG